MSNPKTARNPAWFQSGFGQVFNVRRTFAFAINHGEQRKTGWHFMRRVGCFPYPPLLVPFLSWSQSNSNNVSALSAILKQSENQNTHGRADTRTDCLQQRHKCCSNHSQRSPIFVSIKHSCQKFSVWSQVCSQWRNSSTLPKVKRLSIKKYKSIHSDVNTHALTRWHKSEIFEWVEMPLAFLSHRCQEAICTYNSKHFTESVKNYRIAYECMLKNLKEVRFFTS